MLLLNLVDHFVYVVTVVAKMGSSSEPAQLLHINEGTLLEIKVTENKKLVVGSNGKNRPVVFNQIKQELSNKLPDDQKVSIIASKLNSLLLNLEGGKFQHPLPESLEEHLFVPVKSVKLEVGEIF